MKRTVLVAAGILLILVGIAGIVLPILPGWVLIFSGLSLIAPKLAERLRRRFFRKFFKNGIVYLEEWKKTCAKAGFTTRHFPVVFRKTDDLLDTEKQKEFFAKLAGHSKCVLLNQVHGDTIAVLEDASKFEADGLYTIPRTDAAITNIPGLTLLVFSADCLPIFFLAGSWVGIAHAGWRGTQNDIAKKTIRLLSEKSGCRTKNIQAAFGPCIGPKHYEVGPEFRGYFSAASLIESKNKLYFDLSRENARQLCDAGALPKNISDHEICTVSENEDFYSFRKEKENAGRIISFISKQSTFPEIEHR